MMKFDRPLPMPENALPLTEAETKTLQKYLDRIEKAQTEATVAHEALNDLCMAVAARAGRTEASFGLSADLRFLTPKE